MFLLRAMPYRRLERIRRVSRAALTHAGLAAAIGLGALLIAGSSRAAESNDRQLPEVLVCPGGTTTCLAGRIDNFASGDGSEPTAASAALIAAMLSGCDGICAQFDSIPTDQCMAHRFAGCWTQSCVAGATLTMHAKGGPGSTDTDDLILGEDATPLYSVPFNTLRSVSTGGADVSWDPNDEMTIVLELGALPQGTFGSTDILASLQDGDLDILIQDDTMVDYFALRVTNGSTPAIGSTWGNVKATYR